MARSPKHWLLGWLAIAITAGVCSAQTVPPDLIPTPQTQPLPAPERISADDTAARVVMLEGDVSVLRDSYPWVLRVGDAVTPRQVILTGEESYAVFELSDGSRFEVFPNSRVTFRDNPGDWGDLLDLWLGRVKVYIQRLGGQPNPNQVFTPTAVISVRGTVFEVAVEDEEDTTLVAVDEGQVSVRHRLIGESSEKVLNAGEYLRVYRDTPLARSVIDKGTVIQRVSRAAADALYTVILRGGGSSTPTSGAPAGGVPAGGGPTLPGDTGGETPPAAGGDDAPPSGPPPPPTSPPPPPGG